MLEKLKNIIPRPRAAVEAAIHLYGEKPVFSTLAGIMGKIPRLKSAVLQLASLQQIEAVRGQGSLAGILAQLHERSMADHVVGLAFCEHFKSTLDGSGFMDPGRLCTHSLATAFIARWAARKMAVENPHLVFLAALLHDLGGVALDAIPDKDYREAWKHTEQGMPHLFAEQKVYGMDRRKAWQVVAEEWGLPADLIQIWQGSIQGKAVQKTRTFLEGTSRFADLMGCYLLEPFPGRIKAETFEYFSFIIKQNASAIPVDVSRDLGLLCPLLDLPAPDHQTVSQVVMKSVRKLAQDNARYESSHEKLSYKIHDLEMLANVFKGIMKSLQGDPLTFSVLESVMEGFEVDGAFMLNYEEGGDFAGYAAWTTPEGEPTIDYVHLPEDLLSRSMRLCITRQKPVIVDHPEQEETLLNYLGGVSLVWLVPAMVAGNFESLIGLGFAQGSDKRFNNRDFGSILEVLAGEVALSVENTRLYKQVQKEADTDPVTGISNRRNIFSVLKSEFARFRRKGTPLSVAIFDLDNFKAVNDSRGHLEGDAFLLETARILEAGIRESDYIGRYGGDEFMAVFPQTPVEEVRVVVERIRETLLVYCREFEGPDIGKKLSVSVGIASADQGMAQPDELINQADDALYQAKERGRNCCLVHESDLAPQPAH